MEGWAAFFIFGKLLPYKWEYVKAHGVCVVRTVAYCQWCVGSDFVTRSVVADSRGKSAAAGIPCLCEIERDLWF